MNRKGVKYSQNAPHDKVRAYKILKTRLLKNRGTHCERCDYDTFEILQIHHKDRDRTNNSLENLELICPNCHALEHYYEESWLKKQFA
ncbi:HNH endonuclease [Candidatus Woesebacteria bacterium]|nr:HNH endonuclease [Candidatus Woesebacteria bacterium]